MIRTTPLAIALATLVATLVWGLGCEDPTRDLGTEGRQERQSEGPEIPPLAENDVRPFGETQEEAYRLQAERGRRFKELQQRFAALREEGAVSETEARELRARFDEAEAAIADTTRRPADVYTQARRELDDTLDGIELRLDQLERGS